MDFKRKTNLCLKSNNLLLEIHARPFLCAPVSLLKLAAMKSVRCSLMGTVTCTLLLPQSQASPAIPARKVNQTYNTCNKFWSIYLTRQVSSTWVNIWKRTQGTRNRFTRSSRAFRSSSQPKNGLLSRSTTRRISIRNSSPQRTTNTCSRPKLSFPFRLARKVLLPKSHWCP